MFRRRRLLRDVSRSAIATAYSGASLAMDFIDNIFKGYTTNLIRQSETLGGTFSGVTWSTVRATVTNGVAVNPLTGETTASLLTEDNTASNSHYTNVQLTKVAANVPYTFSFYVKANGRTRLWAWITGTSQSNLASAHYDLTTVSTNTVTTQGTGFTNTGATITDVGSGWYRCTLSAISDTSTTLQGLVGTATTAGSISTTGDSVSGLYLYGLQIEPRACASAYISTARRNLLLRTEEFDNSTWTKVGGSITSNSIANPINGAINADTYVEDGATSAHGVDQALTVTNATTYTISVYVKYIGRRWLLIDPYGTASPGTDGAWFDLQNGVLGVVQANATATITSIGNGWYRCTNKITAAATNTLTVAIRGASADNATGNYAGLTADAFYIWGAQIEASSSATEYQKVTDGTYSSLVTAATYDKVPGWYYSRTGLAYAETTRAVRINHLTYSEALDNTIWTKTSTTVTRNATTAPDGSNNAFMLTDAGATEVFYQNTAAGLYGATVTGSVYVKRGNSDTAYNQFGLRDYDAGTTYLVFTVNLTTGAIAYSVGSSGAVVENVGNGWWRVSATATWNNSGGRCRFYCGSSGTTSSSTNDYTYVWGPQVEYGSVATPYIPTHAYPVSVCDGATVTNYLQAYPANCTRVTSNGIVSEEARTNICLQSQTAGSWTTTTSTVSANTTTAPDGTLTGDTITVQNVGGTGPFGISQAITFSLSTVYTASCYVKPGTDGYVYIAVTNLGSLAISGIFLCTGSGSVGSLGANTTSGTVTAFADGWYRITITFTSDASDSTGTLLIRYASTSNSTTVNLDGTKSFIVWGAQLEAGAFVSSYIPTVGASATRGVDTTYIYGTDAVSPVEGTIMFESGPVLWGSQAVDRAMVDWTSGNEGLARFSGGAISFHDGTNYRTTSVFSTAGASAKYAVSYTGSTITASLNGAASTTATYDGALSNNTRVTIGMADGANQQWNGGVKKVIIYPTVKDVVALST